MDEGTRESGQAVDQRSPEEIRREIAAVRGDLGNTVEALAAKTDVKARARERVEEIKSGARDKASGAREKAPRAADPERVVAVARQNPLPLAVAGALLAGFLIGRAVANR